jgi:PAS domain S-box-containing protein
MARAKPRRQRAFFSPIAEGRETDGGWLARQRLPSAGRISLALGSLAELAGVVLAGLSAGAVAAAPPSGIECKCHVGAGQSYAMNVAPPATHLLIPGSSSMSEPSSDDLPTVGKANLFEAIVESSWDIAIFTIDREGLTTSWNIGAERLFGHSAQEILGLSGDSLFVPEDRLAGAPEHERDQAASTGRAKDDRWHLRKNGSRFWASGLMMPLKTGDGFVKITRDLTAQRAIDELLRESEERFRVLAVNIPQLVFRTRPTGDRTWPSPQWIDFTGFSFDHSLGLGWLGAIHPDDREATQAAWTQALETGEYYIEHRVWRVADGVYRWHQTRAKPVADQQGDWVGTMTDIDDLRGLQARQQVLMAELQHRTRNLLAVVQAIAGQTMRNSSSLADFSEEFEGRLRALSRVQSLLAKSDVNDLDLHSLVETEMRAHGDGGLATRKIAIDGPSAILPASSAQALGLALHELATNALKYGALAQPQGKIRVTWRIASEGPQSQVRLEWRESGVSMPEAPVRRGYGTELIERALPYQLKAKTELDFGPDGVRCVITAPVRENL